MVASGAGGGKNDKKETEKGEDRRRGKYDRSQVRVEKGRQTFLLLRGRGARELVVRFDHVLLDVREDGRVTKVLHREFSLTLSHATDLRSIYSATVKATGQPSVTN